jgi:hypothetical protein
MKTPDPDDHIKRPPVRILPDYEPSDHHKPAEVDEKHSEAGVRAVRRDVPETPAQGNGR